MNIQKKALSHLENNPHPKETEGKLYYGWVVALASGVCVLVGNNFQYSFGVFLKPLINQFGWSRAAISGCVTTRSALSGIISPLSGDLSDRYGPRKLIIAGVCIVGLSYLLASRISSLLELYLILGILTGIGVGFLFAPLVATVTRWFGGRAGMANGIVLSGFGVAQTILPPLATHLILQYGWGTCFIILGVATLVVGTAAWSFIKDPPQAIEIQTPSSAIVTGNLSKSAERTQTTDDYPLSEAFHAPALWIMLIIYMTVAICYQMVVIHVVAAAIDEGATLEAAAIILTLSGITNTLGKLVSGGLANKIGTKLILALCLAAQAPALFFLAGARDINVFYIISAAYGFAYAGTSPVIPTMAADLFGTKSVGSIFGTLNLAYTFGAAIGPLLAGYIFDITGRYTIAFLCAAGTLLLSFVLCLFLKRPQKLRDVAGN